MSSPASPTSPRSVPSGARVSDRNRRLALLTLTIAAFFMAADITITNVAIPTIASELDAPMSALQWVIDSYNIAVAGLLLLGAGLGERFSRKWVFLLGIALFALGSLSAGLAQGVGPLVVARTLMGVGGALVLAPAMSLIAALYPEDERAGAIASWGAAAALGLALGPVAGGLLITVADWQWVFLVNVPAMVAAITLGAVVLPAGRSPDAHRLDLVGATLSVVGLVALLGAIIEGPSHGWTSPGIMAAGAIGVVGLVAFVLWELHCPHPMFEVRVLARRGVLGAAIAMFTAYIGFTGTIFLVAQQLQVVNGVTPLQLGLCLVPFAVALWLVSSRAARISSTIGPARTMHLGTVLMVVAFVTLAATTSLDSVALVIVGLVIASCGCALVYPIASVVILNDLPASLTGSASGTSMLARFAGASVGVAVLGTVLATQLAPGGAHADSVAFTSGLTLAFWSGAVLATGLGCVQAFTLRRWHA